MQTNTNSNAWKPSPWVLKQLQKFSEVADQVPAGVPVIIRIPVTEFMTGLTNQQLWAMEKQGRFPKRVKINPAAPRNGACGHFLNEVVPWLEERRRSRET